MGMSLSTYSQFHRLSHDHTHFSLSIHFNFNSDNHMHTRLPVILLVADIHLTPTLAIPVDPFRFNIKCSIS